jgi:hypothetical protein
LTRFCGKAGIRLLGSFAHSGRAGSVEPIGQQGQQTRFPEFGRNGGNIIIKYYLNKPLSSLALDPGMLKVAKGFKSEHQWTGRGGQAKLMALEEDTLK